MLKQAAKLVLALVAGSTFLTSIAAPALSQTTIVEPGALATVLQLPVYEWKAPDKSPKAAVIAIHGLAMHGTVFDEFARRLADEGAYVVALDLPGYGVRRRGTSQFNYAETDRELYALAKTLRASHPGIPLFIAGESLGGSIAIRMAAMHPELVDGLILSAPAIKVFHSVPKKTIADAAVNVAKRRYELDLSEFIKRDFSDDSTIVEEEMQDPLIRTRVGFKEMVSTCKLVATTRRYVRKIPANMPVLVLQGQKDQMVNPQGVKVLQSHLTNETVHVFPDRGHILIETKHVRPDTMSTILTWMESHWGS